MKPLELLNRAIVFLSAIALLVASCVLTYSVVLRYFSPQPTDWQDEFSVFLLIGVTFMSAAALEREVPRTLGLAKPAIAVRNTRALGKRSMKLNDATPNITVNPETYRVEADGEWLTCEPAWAPPRWCWGSRTTWWRGTR